MGKLRRLQREQRFNVDAKAIWDFIATPANLAAITPSYMGFEVLTSPPESEMYAGQVIAYRVKPLLGISMNWVTEITHVQPGKYFVDEQRAGPYAFWHHLHRLEVKDGQTVMTDLVHYILPFGIAGGIANGLVERRLKEIFDFRFNVLEEKFASELMVRIASSSKS